MPPLFVTKSHGSWDAKVLGIPSHLLPVVNTAADIMAAVCIEIQLFHLESESHRLWSMCLLFVLWPSKWRVVCLNFFLLTVATKCMGWWAANECDAFSLSSVRLACSVHNCLWFCVNLGKLDKCCIPPHSHFEVAHCKTAKFCASCSPSCMLFLPSLVALT